MVRKRYTPPGSRKLRTASVAGFTLTEGIHPAGSSLPWHTHDGPTICFVLRGAFTEISVKAPCKTKQMVGPSWVCQGRLLPAGWMPSVRVNPATLAVRSFLEPGGV